MRVEGSEIPHDSVKFVTEVHSVMEGHVDMFLVSVTFTHKANKTF